MPLKVTDGVVVTEDGVPADYFSFSAKEKIGLPNYSNVELFASIGRYIDAENIEEAKQAVIEEVEDVIAVERQKVVDLYVNN